MAKAKVAKADSPFWHPETPGDAIEGKFLSFQPTKLGLAVQLDTGLIGIGTVLKGMFGSIYSKMKPGDLLRIVFKGKGKRAKLFDLYWKGKQVPGMYRPATPEQATQFFESPDDVPAKKGAKKSKK